jgi:hypothetical protein
MSDPSTGLCDLYMSEEGDIWWVRRIDTTTRWGAATEVAALNGDYAVGDYRVRAIKARCGERAGEPWIFPGDPEGTESFYEVTLRDV